MPTAHLNPVVDKAEIARAYQEDPQAAASEWGAEFRSDLESFVSVEAVDKCVQKHVTELPPVHGQPYSAFIDVSGGSSDSFTLAVGFATGGNAEIPPMPRGDLGPGGRRVWPSEASRVYWEPRLDYPERFDQRDEAARVTVCALREWPAPFDPETVVAEAAQLLRTYGVFEAHADPYSKEWARSTFARYGIKLEQDSPSKTDLYAGLLPLLNSGRIDLLDNPRMIAQLLALDRRTIRGGRESIDHPRHGRDDIVNVVAGLARFCAPAKKRTWKPGLYQLGWG
jgi:hypothetical protein